MQDINKEDPILRSFFDFLYIEKGLSSNTILSYKIDVKTFTEWIKKKDLDYLNVNENHINDFISFVTWGITWIVEPR